MFNLIQQQMKTLTQIAEVKLTYSTHVKASDRQKITSSREAYELFKQTWDEDTIELFEEFKILFLNRANRVLGIYSLSKGGVAGTVADPKLIFAAALKANSSGIILCHNHPSGNLQPSQEDIQMTKKCKQAGDVLQLKVLDHLIITSEGYFSIMDEGLV